MSKSIRTKVSNTINASVYSDNQIKTQFENMELYGSVTQQLNEIEGLIDDVTIYFNNAAITDLSNLKIETASLAGQNTIVEASIATLESQVNSLVETTTASDTIKINRDATYLGNIVIHGNVQVKTLNVPSLVRIDASGKLFSNYNSALITNSDIAVGANIADTKLGTISAPGKVATSATSASVASVSNTILLRDVSGHIFGKTQSENIIDVSDTTVATTAYVKNVYSKIIGSSPDTLDTLNELAAALGDDTNFAANVTNHISAKANLINPVFTGNTVMSNVLVAGLTSSSSAILSTNGVGLLGKTSLNTALSLSSVVVSESNLDIISAPGKVQNSALNVSIEPSANTIVVRDASANLSSTFTNGVLCQNKDLLTNPSYSHIAGPYSQGLNKWPMPTKQVVTDATTKWVLRQGANANPCAGLCWSPEVGRFVGVGYSRYVVSSRSGITWEEYDSQISNDWNDVTWAYDLNLFVAVASSGTNNRVMTSVDASNWTPQNTSGANYSWSAITYSEELKLLVAVSTDVGNSIMTSTDAVSWAMRPYGGNNGFRTVCWSKELNIFIAPEYNVGGATSVAISYNGTAWFQVPSVLTSATYWSVCWSPERRLFVIVGGTNNIAISSDGIKWTNQTISNVQGILQKVVWSSQLGVFVAICSNALNRNLFWVSETGVTWRSVQAPEYPSTVSLNSLTLVWSPELSIFCTITSNGTLQEKVLTSSLTARIISPSTVFNSPFMSIDNSGNWTIPKMSTGGIRVNNATTNGINNTTRSIIIPTINITGTAKFVMSEGATPGYTLTSLDSSGTAMWLPYKTVPLQINGTITSDSIATWTNSGQTRTLGSITLQPGNWTLYYKTAYAAEPTNGFMVPSGTLSTTNSISYPPITNIIEPFDKYTLRLDGTKQLQLKDYLDFNLTGGTTCTLECWIYPTSYTTAGLITKPGRYGLYMTNTGTIYAYDWASSSLKVSTINVPLNTWSHVAVTINSGVTNGTTFYYNGTANATTVTYTFGTTTTNPVIIGGSESTNRFIGYISNVRIWNTLRSSAEIGGNYNKLVPLATGLIASLYLNELPTSTRAANNIYSAPRTITRSIAGIYSAPDISTNAITASQTEDVRNVVFNDIAITGRGLEYVVPITNATDSNAVYFLNSYIETNSTFNVGTGRTARQTYLYAIQEHTIDSTFYFKQYYVPINYANFNSTTGLVLLSDATASAGDILLTPASTIKVGNVWTTWNANYDADFKITFRMNLYSGSATPADGFCIQWNSTNNVTGKIGGGCGAVSNSKYAIVFKTFTSNTIELFQDGVSIQSFAAGTSFYADVYYWVDYHYIQKKLNVYRSSTNVKPGAPSYIFTNVDFPVATPYYIGFGAATGGSFEVHALKSFSLEIISYKMYWILPPITPTNIGVMGLHGNGTTTQLDTIYSGNSYDIYKLNNFAFSSMYLNMNYLNGNYMIYNNNLSFYNHHRDASNILFAAATRVYVRGYTGPVFQLRRSTDGALQDFYTDEYQTYLTTLPNGAGTAYTSWISGATAYVRTWYNQNGNGNNGINTTADTTQPLLVLNNGKYVIQWTGSTYVRIPNPIQPNTVFYEYNSTGGVVALYVNINGTDLNYQVGGGGDTQNDWYNRIDIGGIKLSYVDGTSINLNATLGLSSWRTVALSLTQPIHRSGGGFGFIGKQMIGYIGGLVGFMSQIVFHNKPMNIGNLIGFHNERLFV